MIGRRATVGFLLLSALVLCLFPAQSSWAAKGTNTTWVTCVHGGGQEDFADAHCDEKVAAGTGTFGHVSINAGEETDFTGTNETTGGATVPAVIKGTLVGVLPFQVTCQTVHSIGDIENVHHSAPAQHTAIGDAELQFSNCSVQKPAKCEVKGPIATSAEFEGVEGLGAGKNEMGMEFKPTGGGKVLFTMTFKNKGAESCSLNGKSFNAEGTAIAIGTPAPTAQHGGATEVFTHANTTPTLNSMGIDATLTIAMEDVNGNPISSTTVT